MKRQKQKTLEKITWYIIINPAAAGGRVNREWSAIQSRLDAEGFSYIAQRTEGRGHATQLAKRAIESGYDHLIAVGGDGTNNEVVNGIMLQKVIPSTAVTYALLPIGTGNDWVKTHRIPRRLKHWLAMLKQGHTTVQDVGLVSYQVEGKQASRYFANVAGMGYDAFVARVAERQQHKVSNQLFYFLLIFKCLAQYSLKKARVIFDGEELTDAFYTIHAGICLYSGGGMRFVPHAQPDDGRFALTVIRNVSKLGVVLNTYRLYNGTIGDFRQADIYYAKKIRVEAVGDEPTTVEVDGEFLGETPVEFTLREKALRLVIPKLGSSGA